MTEAKRRLTVYPGQVSMVFKITYTEKLLLVFKQHLSYIPDQHRPIVAHFLEAMESAIATGKRLSFKQSTLSK